MRLINLLCAVFVFDVTSAPGGVTPFLARVRAGEGWGEGVRSCYLRLRFLLAGGSPAAGYFSCFAKKSNQKKATPGSPVLRTSLRCSPCRAAAQLALANCARAQTVLADFSRPSCAARRLSGGEPQSSRFRDDARFGIQRKPGNTDNAVSPKIQRRSSSERKASTFFASSRRLFMPLNLGCAG